MTQQTNKNNWKREKTEKFDLMYAIMFFYELNKDYLNEIKLKKTNSNKQKN